VKEKTFTKRNLPNNIMPLHNFHTKNSNNGISFGPPVQHQDCKITYHTCYFQIQPSSSSNAKAQRVGARLQLPSMLNNPWLAGERFMLAGLNWYRSDVAR